MHMPIPKSQSHIQIQKITYPDLPTPNLHNCRRTNYNNYHNHQSTLWMMQNCRVTTQSVRARDRTQPTEIGLRYLISIG